MQKASFDSEQAQEQTQRIKGPIIRNKWKIGKLYYVSKQRLQQKESTQHTF